jgi:hypothetical protein
VAGSATPLRVRVGRCGVTERIALVAAFGLLDFRE